MEDTNNQDNIFPLDDKAIEFIERTQTGLDELKKGFDELQRQQNVLTERVNGMLNYFALVHNLQGQWKLADNRKELIKAVEPVPVPQSTN